MHLITIFLPLKDNRGRRNPRAAFERLSTELKDRFGGLTSYARMPATGLWKNRRLKLQASFHQDEILITAHRIARL